MLKFLIIFCYIIFAYGLSNMVVYARGPFGIFEWWRGFTTNINERFGEVFNCMICFPTWVGLGASMLDIICFKNFEFTPFNVLLSNVAPFWLIIIMDLCFTSGIVWLIDQFETALEKHGNIEFEDEEHE